MEELTKLKEENKKLKKILNELGYVFIDNDIALTKQDKLDIFTSFLKEEMTFMQQNIIITKTRDINIRLLVQTNSKNRCVFF